MDNNEKIEYLTERNESLEKKNAVLKRQYSEKCAELENITSLYNAIYYSKIWRITMPLRKLKDILIKILKAVKILLTQGPAGVRARLKDRAQTSQNSKKSKNTENDCRFSVIVPLYNTPVTFLKEMIRSVKGQTYGNWELCLADGSDEEHSQVEKVCRKFAAKDNRIIYKKLEKNLGIVGNTNECVKMAHNEYIVLLDHDDVLAPNALEENARAIGITHADVLYSDEDHLSAEGKHVNPLYKPDWSPDLLHSQMYVCHLFVFKKLLFEKIGGFREAYNGAQDYDLMLRLSEETENICHIPKILYSWRETENSTSVNADSKPYAHSAGLNALNDHLKRVYGENAYAEETPYLFVYHARYGFKDNEKPMVSVIIPMKDHCELTEACVNSILEKSTYDKYEILILDNNSEKEETFSWFEKIKNNGRVRIEKADMPFNWTLINNLGISASRGEVFILLNNDTVIDTPDWIERMAEDAMRSDAGIVGGLLKYEDNTIQHAGVVVGLKGWAEHLYKGMKPEHLGLNYISPMVTRNVLAVTGACYAFSKKTIRKIGLLDEEFIICGSDIELCLRADKCGLFNIYDSTVQLYHYESKSRDSFIPEIDFEKSKQAYAYYHENGDPYYNENLDYNSFVPTVAAKKNKKCGYEYYKRRHNIEDVAEEKGSVSSMKYYVGEVVPLKAKKSAVKNPPLRINLLVPSLNKQHVFGGIATALKFFDVLQKKWNCDARILVESIIDPSQMVEMEGYTVTSYNRECSESKQIVCTNDRDKGYIYVHENDIFMATAWWTAYTVSDIIDWQTEVYKLNKKNGLIYFIQDYEPGFYAWSSQYLMSDSTYRLDIPTYAVFNSHQLREFFDKNGYKFAKEWDFNPTLNDVLYQRLKDLPEKIKKKKQIIVYGRPNTARNAFELVVASLKEWIGMQEDCDEWTLLSAGEKHPDVELGFGKKLHSVGKLTLEQYSDLLKDSYAAISLMVSPHPSYPPLEMVSYGIKTITNTYSNKEMSYFSPNIVSISNCSARSIAEKLKSLCDSYGDGLGERMTESAYFEKNDDFSRIATQIGQEMDIL